MCLALSAQQKFFAVCIIFSKQQTRSFLCTSSLSCAFAHAHDKELVCRVPEIMHVTKNRAQGGLWVSVSVCRKSWVVAAGGGRRGRERRRAREGQFHSASDRQTKKILHITQLCPLDCEVFSLDGALLIMCPLDSTSSCRCQFFSIQYCYVACFKVDLLIQGLLMSFTIDNTHQTPAGTPISRARTDTCLVTSRFITSTLQNYNVIIIWQVDMTDFEVQILFYAMLSTWAALYM